MEKIAYGGWHNCYRLSNGIIDLIVTGDVGPRIIRFGFVGAANEFHEVPEQLGRTGDKDWIFYGGHRLWHAPETMWRSNSPDNDPVEITPTADGLSVLQPIEPRTGIQKQIDLAIVPDRAQVTVTHRLTNHNLWAVEFAAWAISVMVAGGVAILPLPPRGAHDDTHLTPTGTLALWVYTDLSDPRWMWGRQHILLRQDATVAGAQKLGVANPSGWIAYANHQHLFVKTAEYVPDATYPDRGSSAELFTEGVIVELETLAPLTQVAPGATVEYVERWYLFDDVPLPRSEADVESAVLPLIRSLCL